MIVWPTWNAQEVFEIQYSFNFCRDTTERLTGEGIIDIDPEKSLEELGDFLIEGEDVLFVNDPETIIPRLSLNMMSKVLKLKNGLAVGPVMDISSYPEQSVDLPFRYFDLATFQEAAETIAHNIGERSMKVAELDPACFLVSSGFLHKIPQDTKINKIIEYLDRDLHISQGALIHRFSGYFAMDRTDLVNLVPQQAKKILDIGCAKGGYGRTLKNQGSDVYLVGIELYPELARFAQESYDQVLTGNFGEIELPEDFDVINMGDILEHLQNPWDNLEKVYSLLIPNGYLVGSVPNIGHWSVVRNLLKGHFDYIPFGLLCIGHLRFFTEKTLVNSLENAGFVIDILEREQVSPTPQGAHFVDEIVKSGWGDRISLMTSEFIFRAQKVSQ
jgi:2-polyprenyl-3-methyl-5-hydroxy-6-metoxy-1,4-benzoquinol methylase